MLWGKCDLLSANAACAVRDGGSHATACAAGGEGGSELGRRLRMFTDTAMVHQIFAFIGIVESFSYEKVFYGQPGDGNLGFDPLGMGKNPASLAYYKVRVCVS